MLILEEVWGETIEKIGLLMVLAIALLSAPALGQQGALAGEGDVNILGDAIFEAEGSIFRFDTIQNTNFDNINVGNDKTFAAGWFGKEFANAVNNLEILKSQDSGDNASPYSNIFDPETGSSSVSLLGAKVNIEQIKAGNRESMAFGYASAKNNIKIATAQQ